MMISEVAVGTLVRVVRGPVRSAVVRVVDPARGVVVRVNGSTMIEGPWMEVVLVLP